MLPTRWHTARPEQKDPMGFWIALSLAVVCLGMVTAVTSSASTRGALLSGSHEICGEISTDDRWTAEEGTYHVTCDATLPADVTLEVEPGVEVRFAAGVSLTISGTLLVNGTPDKPVTFTSGLEPAAAPGDWGGLYFVLGSSDSHLAWCLVEYATTGLRIYAGPGETVSPTFSDCTVRHSSLDGIQIEGFARDCDGALALPTITGCLVVQNGRCGIYGYGHGDPDGGCTEFTAGGVGGSVSGSAIRQNQGSGICLEARWDGTELGQGDVWMGIEANVISGNAVHGVYLHESDRVHSRIDNNLIYENAGAGLQSDAKHEEMDLFVANNTVAGNGGGGVVFKRSALLVHFINNIVVENEGFGLVADASNDPQASNNDLWHNASDDYSGCEPGVDDISADPLFLDVEAGNLRLPSRSPCIDAGTSAGAPATDFDGVSRPQGEEVDIGAYELGDQKVYLPVMLCE
jgi:hypothetical protein